MIAKKFFQTIFIMKKDVEATTACEEQQQQGQ